MQSNHYCKVCNLALGRHNQNTTVHDDCRPFRISVIKLLRIEAKMTLEEAVEAVDRNAPLVRL